MKRNALFLFLTLLVSPFVSLAQDTNGEAAEIKEFEYFKNVTPLREALKQLNMAGYLADEVLWISETDEVPVTAQEANNRLKAAIKLPKKYTIKQASETNHGYAQTFGIYGADEVAIYFVAFRINMQTKKIEEIRVTAN
ncbi:MAG: hypothetical protein K1X81_04960 [Bacteroidia bacterium]|nr:hypothetical protein [Bacteroidia bacterium]